MEKKLDNMEELETIEGYAKCSTTKQACLTDCIGPWENTPTLSDIN